MKKVIVILLALALGLSAEGANAANSNQAPIADAGLSRYAGVDAVILDGTGSYDPDDSGSLLYAWQQTAGPSVVITDSNTAMPTISGFVQTDEIQECEFELVVWDGESTSLPDSVKVIIVPDFGTNSFQQENPPFDAEKPTIIYFGGGDCTNGLSVDNWSPFTPDWLSRANIIYFPNGYRPDSGGGERTYYKYGDMIIVYLSAVAPDYKQPIQTMGWSTGGQPAVDVGIHLNLTYADSRYAINHVTFMDAARYCRSNYSESISTFLGSSVDGEQCWADAYVSATLGGGIFVGGSSPFQDNVLNVGFPDATGSWYQRHVLAPGWYANSIMLDEMNNFNQGIVAGAYWSVIGPGKNLQLASIPYKQTYRFDWYGDASSGHMDFYDERNHPGRLPEPVTLLDRHVLWLQDEDPNSFALSCKESLNAVSYQLLSGTDPYNVADYNIVVDSNSPPEVTMAMLPSSDTWWTVKVRDAYGSTIYADPVHVGQPVGLISYWKLDETEGNIAEDTAGDKDGIVYGDAFWQPDAGKKGGTIELDGIDDYISTDFILNPSSGEFSVFAWIQGGAPGQVIISQADVEGQSAVESGGTWLGISPSDGKLMTGLMSIFFGTLESESVVTDGQWHHVGLVYDYIAMKRHLYVDGAEVAVDDGVVAGVQSTAGLYIGAGQNLEAPTFFSGMIDDVRIYNRVVHP
jgi:hypothetical protein